MNLKITTLGAHTIWFHWYKNVIIVVQLLSHVRLFVTPWTTTRQPFLYFTISWSLLKLMSFELVMPSNHLFLCRPLLLMPSIFPSIRVFSNESALCIRWLKDWSFSFSISPSNEYSGLISFRIDWFDLPAAQGIHTCCPRGSYMTLSNSVSENLCEGND